MGLLPVDSGATICRVDPDGIIYIQRVFLLPNHIMFFFLFFFYFYFDNNVAREYVCVHLIKKRICLRSIDAKISILL